MAFSYNVDGVLTSHAGLIPLPGKTVQLRKENESVVDSDETDVNGYYTVSTSIADTGLHVHWPGESPHYSSVTGPSRGWAGTTNESHTDDLESTFSNNNPTRGTVGNKIYDEDSGLKTVDKTMGDADSGDDLTPVKLSGPSWGTISKINATTYRWTFDTDASTPGVHGFSYRIEDNYGGNSTTESFNVTINAANNPPVLQPVPTKFYNANTGTQQFDLVATDPDSGDVLTYTKTSGPAAVTVNSSTGRVSVNTNSLSEGNYSVTYRVTDDGGLYDEETHKIVIKKKIATNLSGTGTVTATAKVKRKISVSATGTGTPTVMLGSIKRIEVSLSGIGEFSGSMVYTAGLVTTQEGVGIINPVLTIDLVGIEAIVATMSGVGSMSADMTPIPAPIIPVSASLEGVGTLEVFLGLLVPISASMSGIGSLTGMLNILGRTVMVPQELNKFGRWTQFTITHEEPERIKFIGLLIRAVSAGEQRLRDAGREVTQELNGFGRWTQFRFTHSGTESLKLEGFVLRVTSAGEYR